MNSASTSSICSSSCETALIDCVGARPDHAKYRICMTDTLVEKMSCPAGCIPTLKMLKKSERVDIELGVFNTFGAGSPSDVAASALDRPEKSRCQMSDKLDRGTLRYISGAATQADTKTQKGK